MSNATPDENSDTPEITFGPSAAETVLEELGFGVTDEGVIVDGAGEPVEPAFGDGEITVKELGGFAKDEDGDIVIVADDFCSLVEYVKQFEMDASHTSLEGGGNVS